MPAFATVVDVVSWLQDNPVRSLRPRQLPIRGVDSKWFEAQRRLVTALLTVSGQPDAAAVLDAEPRVRLRFLDPALAPAGLRDITVPVGEFAGLQAAPRLVSVSEDLESVLDMPDWPGAVAVHGSGYAVDTVALIGWIRNARVICWGDLDTHGFAILNRLCTHLPGAASALMDEATLIAHRGLWVSEPTPHTGTFAGLTGTEERALARIRGEGDVRLEQERIPWATALAALRAAAGDTE